MNEKVAAKMKARVVAREANKKEMGQGAVSAAAGSGVDSNIKGSEAPVEETKSKPDSKPENELAERGMKVKSGGSCADVKEES